jgi:hypothetical protein
LQLDHSNQTPADTQYSHGFAKAGALIMTIKPFGHLLTVLALPALALWHGLSWLNALQHRERTRLIGELSQTRGLMQLLMKQRNGYRWSAEDRRIIRTHLKTILGLSPYVVLLVAPGGLVALPFMAWWLDRRKGQRTQAVRVK